jgi:hypothetical protein
MSGQIHSGLPWTQGAEPVIGDGWVQIGGPSGQKVFFDQLSKADQDLVIQYLLSAQFPVLVPPAQIAETSNGDNKVGAVSSSSIQYQVEDATHKIITAMLDSWIINLQKNADESKRADEKKTIEKMAVSYQEIKHQQAIAPNEIFPIFAIGMIIMGTGITQALLPDPTVGTVQMNPIVSMYNQTIPHVMTDMQAQMSMIGAIFAVGVQYFTVAQLASSESGKAGKEAQKDLNFAKGYAENMIGLISSAPFNSYLMAIVSQSIPGDKTLAPQKALDLVTMLKIILLSSALALLYQAKAGKMTSTEFAGMLSGNIQFAPDDMHGKLIVQIKAHLALLSPKDQEKILTSLLEYFDTSPNLDTLADPSKVLQGMYARSPKGDLPG